MEAEIYGDVLFIINFSMDFLALYLVGRLMHLRLSAFRVIAGATLGGIYGVVSLILPWGDLAGNLLSLGVMLLMCLLSFDIRTWRRFAAAVTLFAGVNMLIGGIMTAAFVKLGPYRGYISIGGDIHTVWGDLPVWLFALLAALSALFTWGMGKLFRRERDKTVCRVKLAFGGEERDLSGLVDSGNLLTEPFSDTPVMFLKGSYADFLPEKLLSAMKNGTDALDAETVKRIRLIPTVTVSGDGITVAALPTRCYIFIDGEWEAKKALVALDQTEGDFGGFPLLVPSILL